MGKALGQQTTSRLVGAEAVARMLQGYKVTSLFGLCGDAGLPLCKFAAPVSKWVA